MTWRYVNNHKEIQSKRTKCNENDLLQTIILLRNKRRVKLSPIRCTYLNKRSMLELVELMSPKEVTENERKGRSSGSLNWKLSRGEQNVNNVQRKEILSLNFETKTDPKILFPVLRLQRQSK